MTVAIPQDKNGVLIRVTSRGYIVAQTMRVKLTYPTLPNGQKIEQVFPQLSTEFVLPDIDSLLNWLANHLAVPEHNNTAPT